MQGTWKKYHRGNELEAERMLQDVKGSRFEGTSIDLMGSIFGDVCSGDIYFYYGKDGKPLFYIKYEEVPSDKTYYMGWCGDGNLPLIPAKYLNIVAPKIKELDQDQKYLDIVQKYEDYKRLLRIARKKSLSGEDLIFLYDHTSISLARDILGGKTKNHTIARKMQDDYDNLEEKEKVAFIVMLSDHYYPKNKELKVTDSKILTLAACYAGCDVLAYASEELLEDEEFIINILKVSPRLHTSDTESEQLLQFLPVHFFDNKRVLSSIFAWLPEFIFEMGYYKIFKGDIIYKENDFYPDPSRRFRNAMVQDTEFQETILQSILYGFLKQDRDIKFLESTLLSWQDKIDEEYRHDLQFDVGNSTYFAQQLFYYFDRDILKNAIEKFYGPFQEEDKSHQNHDRLVLVQKFVQKLSKIK